MVDEQIKIMGVGNEPNEKWVFITTHFKYINENAYMGLSGAKYMLIYSYLFSVVQRKYLAGF